MLSGQYISDISDANGWPYQLNFNGDGTGYGAIGYGYPDFEYEVTDNGDGSYTITFVVSAMYESFLVDNTATLNADGTITCTIIDGETQAAAVFTA